MIFNINSTRGHTGSLLVYIILTVWVPGLDIGYVPAGPDAFFRWSGQFGPQQFIFYWPGGPVDYYYYYFFFFIFFFLGLPFIFEIFYEGGS